MTFLGLGEIGEITFFPSLTVTVAVAVIMVIVIAITHKNYVIPSSRSALNDNFLSLYLSIDSYYFCYFLCQLHFFSLNYSYTFTVDRLETLTSATKKQKLVNVLLLVNNWIF